MRNESMAQPFEAELDRYVETIVLRVAAQCGGDSAALAAWMEGESAAWRGIVASWRSDVREAETPAGRRMIAEGAAHADLLEKLAAEVGEARPPKTRH